MMRFGELVELATWMDRDKEVPLEVLALRDRAAFQRSSWAASSTPPPRVALVRAWLAARRAEAEHSSAAWGERATSALRWTTVFVVMAGSLAGGTTTWGLLRDNAGPTVNILWPVFVLMALQSALALLSLTVCLARRTTPWSRSLAGIWYRFTGRSMPSSPRMLTVIKAPLWARAQLFGVAFNAAAILVFAFSSLGVAREFTWQSTFDIPPEHVHRLAVAIGTPFAWIAPTPSLDHIRESRLEKTIAPHPEHLHARRAWVPWLLGGMVTYGLLPRIALWSLAGWVGLRYRQRILASDAVESICHRMTSPVLDYLPPSEDSFTPNPVPPPCPNKTPCPDTTPLGAAFWIIPQDLAARHQSEANRVGNQLGLPPLHLHVLGPDPADFNELVRLIHRLKPIHLVLVTAAWSPPLHEDKLRLRVLHDTLGKNAHIHLLLEGKPQPAMCFAPVRQRDIETWREFDWGHITMHILTPGGVHE